MSEENKKWCPFVRFVVGPDNASWQGNAYTNRGEEMEGPTSCLCIEAQCACWNGATCGLRGG